MTIGHNVLFGSNVYGYPVRCPKCFGRNFTRGTKDKWKCDGCGFQGNDEVLVDKTPEGCFEANDELCLRVSKV